MKVVLDTNIFVAGGFNPRSSSAEILRLLEQGTIDLAWHETTRRETRRMVEQIPRLSWERVSGLFKPEFEHKGPLELGDYDFVEDRDDRKFAALGEASHSLIVTNDQHLLSQRHRIDVDILRPREFISLYVGGL